MSLLAITFFVIGFDNNKDYLRIYHGIWHIFYVLAMPFILQVKVKPKDYVKFKDFLMLNYEGIKEENIIKYHRPLETVEGK